MLDQLECRRQTTDVSRWQQEQLDRRYKELQTIGRGRTAVVKLAQDTGTGQRVALKQVDVRKVSQTCIRAEYSLLTSLSHCAIVRAFAIFENAPSLGVDTIVMEMAHGVDVLSYICSYDSLAEAEIRQMTQQLMSALEYLQLRQIVHCDIKPENLLVHQGTDGKIHLKIIDFGSAFSARATDSHVDYKPCVSFDLEFCAPEVLDSPPVPSPSTDVWSSAVLVYVLMSGVSPFLDDSPEETTGHILAADFSFPPELFPADSADAQDFISELLIRDPSSRPTPTSVLSLPWLQLTTSNFHVPTSVIATFVQRRKPQVLLAESLPSKSPLFSTM